MAALVSLALFNSLAFAQDDEPKGKKIVVPDGLKALKHPDAAVRYKAAVLLARLGPVAKFAVPELREALKDENPWVRVRVAEALWKIDKTSPLVLVPVLAAAMKEKNADLRALVPEVLGMLGPKAKSAVPALTDALKDKEEKVQVAAVLALGEIGPGAKDAAPALLELVQGKDGLAEVFVSGTLSRLGPSVIPLLCKTLADKLPARREAAALALSMMEPPPAEAAAALTDALLDKDDAVRGSTVRALGRIGQGAREALPRLRTVLKESDSRLRLDAALALYQIDGALDQLPVVIGMLGSKDVADRGAACRVLGEIGPAAKEAVPALSQALAAKEALLRRDAAQALGKIGPAAIKASAALENALNDEDDYVRPHAAFALWRVSGKSEKALETLKKELTSKDIDSRRAAAQAFSDMGKAAQSALDLLAERYQDAEEDHLVRNWLADALRKIDPVAARKLGIR